MSIDSEFWRSKKVLVTGHTGFKGSWISLWLQKLGATVIGYSLEAPTEPSLFEMANVAEGMTSIKGDVRDMQHLSDVMSEYQPEIVIHMAAQPLVRYSYDNPIETYETNVMGTVKLLEAVRRHDSVRAVLCITTDKCYQNNEWYWGYREIDPMGGHDPYSSSKGCAELVVSGFRDSYFPAQPEARDNVAVASARAGNVIGGGDWAVDRLIPDILKAMGDHKPVIIRQPRALRPWQHVLEPLCGYLILAEKLYKHKSDYAEAWNFGPNEDDVKPVSWIADYLSTKWGENASWELDSSVNPHEAHYLNLDISKAKSRLGFKPKLNLATALDWGIEWHRCYLQGNSMRDMTEKQIERYENLQV